MRKNLIVGILRENKESEKRTPLTPSDVTWLIKQGIMVEIESSSKRIFSDQQYKNCGAKILDKFDKASLLLGIKEPRIDDLCEDKVYMIFSHTIKGQSQNIPLLKTSLK